jgi:hypothetical protein
LRIVYTYIAITVLIAITLSIASINTAMGAYNSWAGYRNPYIDVLEKIEPVRISGEPVAKHIVFILLDGLSTSILEDLGRENKDLEKLISLGAFYPNGLTNMPSYSLPGRASILTGAPPEINEVMSNDYKGALRIDSIVKAAKEAGFKILCSGDRSIETMFQNYIDECSSIEEGSGHGALALVEGARLFKKYSEAGYRVFLWIGVSDIDMIGHLTGSSGSPEYNSTVINIARLTLSYIETLTKENTLIVILNDHGFKRGGHHGGPEPEVRRVFTLFIGPGVRPGIYSASYTQNDIASTVAMLMGLRIPAQSIGKPLTEGFNLPSSKIEEYRRASEEQGSRVIAALEKALGVKIGLGTNPQDAYREITGRLYSEGMGSRLAIAIALSLLIPAGLYASIKTGILSSRKTLILIITGILVYESIYWIAYYSIKGPTSLSDILSLGELLDKVRLAVAIAGLVTGLLIGVIELTPLRTGLPKILIPILTSITITIVLSLIYAAPFYVGYGVTVRFPLPDWGGGFMLFLYLVKASFTGLIGIPLAIAIAIILSIAGHYIYRLSRGSREHGA